MAQLSTKKEYREQDYDLDRKYIAAHDALQNPGVLSKLEVLMDGPGQKTLFVNLPEASLEFLSMKTAYEILDKPGTATSIILGRSKIKLNPGGLSQLVDELTTSIHKRVNELFGQRYNGAKTRVARYERRLIDPKLKELRVAVRSRDPESVYVLAERIAIMTEHLRYDNPVVEKYMALLPQVQEVLSAPKQSPNVELVR